MGMFSKFLRVSGASTVIDYKAWKEKAEHTGCELFPLSEHAANKLRDTSVQFQQVNAVQIRSLMLFCSTRNIPLDVKILIASFFPIDYITLRTFGEIQSNFKIHGYWRLPYLHSLCHAYECMVIDGEKSDSKVQNSQIQKQRPYMKLEYLTPLSKELMSVKLDENFVSDVQSIVARYVRRKKAHIEMSSSAPRLEFQYEEHCIFFIEFSFSKKGIDVGFIDYFHNAMMNKDQSVMWDKKTLVNNICDCDCNTDNNEGDEEGGEKGDEEEESDEESDDKCDTCNGDCSVEDAARNIDEIMKTIPTHLLTATVYPCYVERGKQSSSCAIS